MVGWPDTFVAGYTALTQRQAGTFVCMDPALASAIDNSAIAVSIVGLIGSA